MEFGAVIAERRLRISGTRRREVLVRIGLPRPSRGAAGFVCAYSITGIGEDRTGYAGGIDALQALELAILLLPAELDALRRDHPTLRWADAPEGDYGFTSTVMSYPPESSPGPTR